MRSSERKTVVCVIGTRPEAIKMAPVIRALRTVPWTRCRVVCTGQHRDLVEPVLDFFQIRPDLTLDAMRTGQTLSELTERLIGSLRGTLAAIRPGMVLAQGDTASVLAAAMVCFAQKIPFGHVEAGLRSGNLEDPFPEEANRVVVSHLADMHFAPTITARTNLLREGIRPEAIYITGNTVIDALLDAVGEEEPIGVPLDPARRLVLVTVHRRGAIGEPLRQICQAIQRLHDRLEDLEFLWPLHPNPQIEPVVRELLSGRPRIHLSKPLAYGSFVTAMRRSAADPDGLRGIQEEAPTLGKRVLVLRAGSERPEAVRVGCARLVGHDPDRIVHEAWRVLADPRQKRQSFPFASPFGDGRAAPRIVAAIAARPEFARQARYAG